MATYFYSHDSLCACMKCERPDDVEIEDQDYWAPLDDEFIGDDREDRERSERPLP